MRIRIDTPYETSRHAVRAFATWLDGKWEGRKGDYWISNEAWPDRPDVQDLAGNVYEVEADRNSMTMEPDVSLTSGRLKVINKVEESITDDPLYRDWELLLLESRLWSSG
jgi:hypothetical protein